MSREEFPVKVRKAAWDRAAGTCECGCGRAFGKHPKERPEYHHRIEAYLDGDASLENCMCIRSDCHAVITATESAPKAAKVRREDRRQKGLQGRKSIIPGSKASKFKRRIDGSTVLRKDT